MTATSEGYSRRSKGFTIDSIIGTDSERSGEKRTKSPECSHDFRNVKHARVSHSLHDKDGDHIRSHEKERSDSICSDKQSNHHSDRDKYIGVKSEKFGTTEMTRHSELDSAIIHRTSTSLHSDSVRDFNFSSANIREGVRTVSSPESLRHLHDSFIEGTSVHPATGVPLGHLEAQRQFRHPLVNVGVGGFPPQLPVGPQVHPMLLNGARDFRHMYPYIADRYPGCFLPRYGMGGMPGLFFQPYRKPKRIRTAFSPSQLLQLEKSFEKSHYVVGQERKDLANELQLTETQVKVWFQNRRTKYKRTKGEQDGGTSGDGADDHKSDSDISDIEDIDDVGDEYNAHAYHHVIQTC